MLNIDHEFSSSTTAEAPLVVAYIAMLILLGLAWSI
jgi:hypothetical protein